MGKTQSKEEIIIAQAGNSGGQTSTPSTHGFGSIQDITSIVIIGLLAICFGWCVYKRVTKAMIQRIRAELREEIGRSREVV